MSRFLRALLFALLCISPQFVTLATHGSHDPRILGDGDESFYLSQLQEFGHLPIRELFKINEGNLAIFSNPEVKLPHNLIDIAFSRVSPLLSPIQIGLLLDLICCCLIYILGSALLDQSGGKCWHSEIGATVMIKLPWLFSIEELLQWPLFGEHYLTWSHSFFPNPPALRAVYTQLGMLGFIACILLYIRIISNREQNYRIAGALVLGILSASLLYTYFFAWASLLCVLGIASLVMLWQHRKTFTAREVILPALSGSLSLLLVSLPGLAHFFRSGTLYAPGPGEDLPRIVHYLDFSLWWYVPPLTLAFITVLGYQLFRRKTGLSTLLLFSLLTAVPLLMNIQGVLGRWITPYHFPLFFIHPLVSAIGIVLILKQFTEPLPRVLLGGCIVITILTNIYLVAQNARTAIASEGPLLEFLATSVPPGASIASLPYDTKNSLSPATISYMLLPYWIKAFTPLQSYSQFMSFDPDRRALARRELSLNLLFKGEIAPIIACPDEGRARVSASDVLLGATAYHQAQRLVDCSVLRQLAQSSTSCSLISEHPVEYMIWESTFDFPQPRWYSSFSHLQWKSLDGRYSVYQIDYAALRTFFCSNQTNLG